MSGEQPHWAYEDYSAWSRQLAKNYSRAELEREVSKCDGARATLSNSHLNAIRATTSMTSQSQRRAQSGNAVAGNYERLRAHQDALEIHEFYPQHAKTAKGVE